MRSICQKESDKKIPHNLAIRNSLILARAEPSKAKKTSS